MKKLYSVVMGLFMVSATINTATARSVVRVKAIGASPRGQFVAFEEFGYKNGRKYPFAKIRVMNVWKSKYVADSIQIVSNDDKMNLGDVREKAKSIAITKLKEFNISL